MVKFVGDKFVGEGVGIEVALANLPDSLTLFAFEVGDEHGVAVTIPGRDFEEGVVGGMNDDEDVVTF